MSIFSPKKLAKRYDLIAISDLNPVSITESAANAGIAEYIEKAGSNESRQCGMSPAA